MEKIKNESCRPHCLLLPFPTQDFTVPMLQFAKRLVDKGLSITLVVPDSFFKTFHKSSTIPFPIHTISDGYDTAGGLDEAPSYEDYLTTFQQVGSQSLTQLLLLKNKNKNKKKLSSSVDCIIYSSVLPWALDVAKEFGLVGAAFFNSSCAVECIYYHVHEGLLKVPLNPRKSRIMVEGLPLLEPGDMPALSSHFGRFDMFKNQFSSSGAADWLFCNTFYELEKKVVDVMMKKLGRFRAIGPHIPSKYLDKRLKDNDKDYGLYTFKPGSRACIKWLKEQPDNSVVYISLGSVSWAVKENITELAWGIKASDRSFLWVVEDETKRAMVPKKFMEESEASGKGLVVSWCPQVEALAQRSIGCVVTTNCGWNSVLEAQSLGVPMVGMPLRSDQRTCMKFVRDVWKTGVKAEPEWVTRREAVEGYIREVMEGEKAGKMKRNAERLRELARKAVDEGGSSDRNIDEFVASLIQS